MTSKRRNRRERWLLLSGAVAVALFMASSRWNQRTALLDQEELRLSVQARAIEQNLARQLRGVRAALVGVREDLPGWQGADRSARARMRLEALCEAIPGLRAMHVVDAAGRIVASSLRDDIGSAQADAPWLRAVQERPDPTVLFVSPPVRGPGRVMSVNLSVVVPDAAGAFDGAVMATLDPAFFNTVLASVLYADDMQAAIVHDDGTLLVVNPANDAALGVNLATEGSMFLRHRAGGRDGSVQRGNLRGSGDERLLAQQTLRPAGLSMDQALVVGVTRAVPALLAPWQEQSLESAAFVGIAGVGCWFGLLALQRRRASQEQLVAEQQAREARDAERLRLALSGGDLALWDLDIVRSHATVNERWHTMLGYAAGEVSPDDAGWQSLLHPDDRDRVVQAQNEHIAGRTPGFEATYRMRHRAGHWIWVLDRGRVVERDAAGAALRMVGTHMDVTERMQAEETLRRSEESLAITLHSIGDAVIATDAQGLVTRMNDAARRLTGWAGDSALGQPLSVVFRIVSALTRQPETDPVARVLASGEVVGLANGTLLLARDGGEHQIADSAAPIRDAAGRIVGVVLVFSDVSEQYRMLQDLRDREAQLSSIADALPGPVARLDLEDRYLFANAAYERWFGIPASALLGRTRAETLGEDVAQRVAPYVERVKAGESVTTDLESPTLQGRRQSMVTFLPDHDAAGAVRGYFTITVDITERQQAETALRLSEQRSRGLLDALSSGVVVHGVDSSILRANPAASRILGLSMDQLQGRQAIDPRWAFLEDDGSPMALARYPVNQVLAQRVPLRDLVVGLRRPDLPHPLWVLCNAFPLLDAAGAVQEVVVTFSDFTERKLAEEALRLSESRLRMAGRLARLGSWRLELPGRTVWLSPEAVAILEAPAEVLPGVDALRPLVVPTQRALFDEVLAAQVPFDVEVEAASLRGRPLHLRVLGETVRDDTGAVVAMQGAVQDVTEARREQQQLRLLEAAVERLNDVVLITEAEPLADPGPRVVFVNPAFERLTGWRRDEVLGRPSTVLLGQRSDPAQLAEFAHLLARQQTARGELVQYARDGREVWVEVEVVPLLDAQGRTTHMVTVQRDITERRRAAAAVRAAQDELAATLQAVPDLLFDIDLHGRVHGHHSPRRDLLVMPAEQQVGRTAAEVLPPDAAAVVMQALQDAHQHGVTGGQQYELPLPQGRRWFELSIARKAAAPGETPRFILLSRDVTERKQGEQDRRTLERQLREAQKIESIGTLAGGIAHDFNNILAAILGNVALARSELDGAAAAPAAAALTSLDQINRAALRARSLVQQILTFSRRGPQELAVQPLQPVVEETLSLLRATMPASVRLDTRLAAEPLPVEADATQLQQVVMNLCTNAWHALPEGRGRIEVGLARAEADDERVRLTRQGASELPPGPCVHLWVSDNGSGMDAETRSRIFDPFFTTKPVGQGTGLGLSVVHGIVRSHRGAIALDSAPGVGSTFHVFLPLAAQHPDAADLAVGGLPSVQRGAGQRLLVVDDDDVMGLMVQRLLQREGYQVSVCGGALDALAQVAAHPEAVDAVISDHNMPEMSGTELAERLARLRPGLPVIISSGYITDTLRQQAARVGVRALLQKEHTLDRLPALVHQVLSGLLA